MDHLPAYDTALGVHNPSRLGLQLRDRLLDLHNLVLGRNYNLDVIFKRNRFNVEDVLVNCLYAQGLRDLAKMCALSGDNPGCDSCNHLAERTEQAILARCYDENTQAYFSSRERKNVSLKCLPLPVWRPSSWTASHWTGLGPWWSNTCSARRSFG